MRKIKTALIAITMGIFAINANVSMVYAQENTGKSFREWMDIGTTLNSNGEKKVVDENTPYGKMKAVNDNFADATEFGMYELDSTDEATNKITGLFAKIYRLIQAVVYISLVFVMLYAGFMMLTSQGDEGEIGNQKKSIIWALVGIAVFVNADILATQVFFNPDKLANSISGGGVLENANTIKEAGKTFYMSMQGITSFMATLISSIGLVMLIMAGVNTIFTTDQGEIDQEKTNVFWISIGLLMMGLGVKIVDAIFSPSKGFAPNGNKGMGIIVDIINQMLGFSGMIAILVIVGAGIMIVANLGEEGQIDKAKGIIISAVVGLVIIFSSYTVINTFTTMNMEINKPEVVSEGPAGQSIGGF